jgi:hypothetical protein
MAEIERKVNEPAWVIRRPFAASDILKLAKLCEITMTEEQATLLVKAMYYSMMGPPEEMPEFQYKKYTNIQE